MKSSRSTGEQIRAITFDLDDTLYDNQPVLLEAEKQLLRFIHQHHPSFNRWEISDFTAHRQQLKQQQPEIAQDVTVWRHHSLKLLFGQKGYSVIEAERAADSAIAHFIYWRNQITVPRTTYQTLTYLQKSGYRLGVITNGNAKPSAFGLGHFFDFVFRAGQKGGAKPAIDMFQQAEQFWQLSPKQLLHVGDEPATDIQGAIKAGWYSCWLNNKSPSAPAMLITEKSHFIISQLDSLISLL